MHVCERVAQRQERPQVQAVAALARQGRQAWTNARLVDLLAMRGPMGLVRAIYDWSLDAWKDALRPSVRTLMLAGEAIGKAGLEIVEPVQKSASVRKADISFSFDEVDPNAVKAARDFRNELITRVTAETAAAVQLVVADGIQRGKAPDWIAQRVRLIIGLTPRQAQALINYENGLRTQQTEALRRKVNPMIEADVEQRWGSDRPATESQLNRLVSDYGDRLLSQRAVTIARTETLRAANLGAEVSIRQAREDGRFGNLELRRFWLDTPDEKTRPEHREVPKLNRRSQRA